MDNPERDELGSAGGWASSHSSHRAGIYLSRYIILLYILCYDSKNILSKTPEI